MHDQLVVVDQFNPLGEVQYRLEPVVEVADALVDVEQDFRLARPHDHMPEDRALAARHQDVGIAVLHPGSVRRRRVNPAALLSPYPVGRGRERQVDGDLDRFRHVKRYAHLSSTRMKASILMPVWSDSRFASCNDAVLRPSRRLRKCDGEQRTAFASASVDSLSTINLRNGCCPFFMMAIILQETFRFTSTNQYASLGNVDVGANPTDDQLSGQHRSPLWRCPPLWRDHVDNARR